MALGQVYKIINKTEHECHLRFWFQNLKGHKCSDLFIVYQTIPIIGHNKRTKARKSIVGPTRAVSFG